MEVTVKTINILGCILLLWTGCQNWPVIVPIPPVTPEGYTVANTGCKIVMSMIFEDQYPSNFDVIKYAYENGTLNLKHINTAFNCCPDSVGGEITISGDTITISEFETSGLCNCLCLFDVEYRIDHLDKKKIILNLSQLNLGDDMDVHNIVISLADSTAGIHKINRGDHYPWMYEN